MKKISQDRQDGRYELFANISQITLHKKCRQYILKKNNKFAYKNTSFGTEQAQDKSNFSPIRKKIRLSSGSFNFKELCIFCGMKADISGRNSKTYTRRVCIIQDENFQDRMMRMCQEMCTSYSKNIIKRITLVDLVGIEAKYHLQCYESNIRQVFRKKKPGSPRGRPYSNDINIQMEKIFDYMEHSNDSHFTFSELAEQLGIIF